MSWFGRNNLGSYRARGALGVRSRGLGVAFYLLLGVGLGLFSLNVFYPSKVNAFRGPILSLGAPVLSAGVALMAPVRAFSRNLWEMSRASEELVQLRRENQELRGWKWRAGELERKLKDLRALAKVERPRGVGFVTAQVVSVSPGPRAHSVLIGVGSARGVRVGDGVVNGDGLVGLVVELTGTTARVRLLDDHDTRLEVLVGRDGVPGYIVGTGAGLARFVAVNEGAVLRAGDKVVTSGALAGVPRGLKVGMLVYEGDSMRVGPYAALGRLEFVSVLLRPEIAQRRVSGVAPGGE